MALNLDGSVTQIPYISDAYAAKLARIEIYTVKDFLTHFPRKYSDMSELSTVSTLTLMPDLEEMYVVKAQVKTFKNIYLRGKKSMQIGTIEDTTGTIAVQFFNQPFLANTLKQGTEHVFSGKVKYKGNKITFHPTTVEKVIPGRELMHTARIVPEYALTAGISRKWFRNRIKNLLDTLDKEDYQELMHPINPEVSLLPVIHQVHLPESKEALDNSVKQLSVLELTHLQLHILKSQQKQKRNPPRQLNTKSALPALQDFKHQLPFTLTQDQQESISDALQTMIEGKHLRMLLQGDVGSGKTAVAVAIAVSVIAQGKQVVLLTPTTVLAEQHFQTVQSMLAHTQIQVTLVTSQQKKNEQADLLIGTTAILARKHDLITDLGLIIIDEQHRFGVAQRETLLGDNSDTSPHHITMTATPIPRTIAATFFTDMQVARIRTKPKGRKTIQTYVVPEKKRQDSISWIKNHISQTRQQAYWICPLIEVSEKIKARSVQEAYEFLTKALPENTVGLLHGSMKADEKNAVMESFASGTIDVLVATSVIEVGIDVPNATALFIENAERFGLAQLHQIRGRVGRSDQQSYCFLFLGKESTEDAQERLTFIAQNQDGNAIAEFDLARRGPGEVYGTKQSGIPNLKIAKLDNIDIINQARDLAAKLMNDGISEIYLFA